MNQKFTGYNQIFDDDSNCPVMELNIITRGIIPSMKDLLLIITFSQVRSLVPTKD